MLAVTSPTTLLIRYFPDSGTVTYSVTITLDDPITNRWVVLGLGFISSSRIL